jgi:hypothetical protein
VHIEHSRGARKKASVLCHVQMFDMHQVGRVMAGVVSNEGAQLR